MVTGFQHKNSGVGTIVVERLCGGEREVLLCELELVVGLEEGLDYVLVFGFLDAAGAVADSAGGLEEGGGSFEEGPLGGGEVVDRLGAESVAGLDSTGEDAGVGAGDIEQNCVEGAHCAVFELGVGDDGDALEAQAGDVFLDALQPLGVDVGGEDRCRVLRQLGNLRGLGPRRRAHVENGPSRLGLQRANSLRGRKVLHGEQALGEAGEFRHGVRAGDTKHV